jgi:hypothetical protein
MPAIRCREATEGDRGGYFAISPPAAARSARRKGVCARAVKCDDKWSILLDPASEPQSERFSSGSLWRTILRVANAGHRLEETLCMERRAPANCIKRRWRPFGHGTYSTPAQSIRSRARASTSAADRARRRRLKSQRLASPPKAPSSLLSIMAKQNSREEGK